MRAVTPIAAAVALLAAVGAPRSQPPRTYATQMVNASCGAVSPDGATFLDNDGLEGSKVFLRSTETGKVLQTLPLPHRSLNAAFSPDGRSVVIGGDTELTIWHLADGKHEQISKGEPIDIGLAAYSQDGRSILTVLDGLVRNWDAASHRLVSTLHDDNQDAGLVMTEGYDPDATRILTASNDLIAVWNAHDGTLVASVLDETAETSVAHFNPDGARVVGALSSGPTVHIWNAAHLKEQLALVGHTGTVLDARFSPDGRFVVTASQDKTARLWDAATGKVVAVLLGHEDAVNTAVFSPDGTRIATGSEDRTVRLWDLTGKEIARFDGFARGVSAICFDKTGRRFATIGYEEMSFRKVPDGKQSGILPRFAEEDARRWDALYPITCWPGSRAADWFVPTRPGRRESTPPRPARCRRRSSIPVGCRSNDR